MSENKTTPDYVEEIKNISILLYLVNELSHMLRNEYAKDFIKLELKK
jgi:hypothetical protein